MKSDKNTKLEKVLYIIGITLIQFEAFGSFIVWFSPIRKDVVMPAIFFIIAAILLRIKTKKNKLNLKWIIAIMLFAAIAVLSYHYTNNMMTIYLLLLSISNIDKDEHEIVKADLTAKIVVFAIILFNYIAGLTLSSEFTRGEKIREAFGFSHPNSLGYFLTILYIDILMIYQKKLRSKKLTFVPYIIFIILAIMADSRTSIIIITMIFSISIVKKKEKKTKEKALTPTIVLLILPIILTILSIAITIGYQNRNSLAIAINRATSGRIFWQSYYLTKYPINIFGRKMSFRSLPLDNGYLRIIINYGVIGLLASLIPYILALNKKTEIENKNKYLVLLLFYSLMEWMPLRVSTTPFILLIASQNNKGRSHGKRNEH